MECYSTGIPECTYRERLQWILLTGTLFFSIFFFKWRNPIEKERLESLWTIANSRSGWAAKLLYWGISTVILFTIRPDGHTRAASHFKLFMRQVFDNPFYSCFWAWHIFPLKIKIRGFGGGASSCAPQLIILLYSPCVTKQIVSSWWLIVLLANWK